MAQPPAPLAYSDLERLAISIAKSELFGIKTPEQALALMMIAQAEGRHPALAARDYDVIQGRPSKKAEAMARDFLDAGGKIEWHTLDDTIADATFAHPAGGTVRIVWDMARATKAELLKNAMWKKYPRQMLRSRTVSEGVRTVWPLATSGMYEPGEVGDMAPAGSDPIRGATIEGETIDATADQNMTAQRRMIENWQRGEAQREQEQREAEAPPVTGSQRRPTISEWLEAFALAANDVQSPEESDRLIGSEESRKVEARLIERDDPRLIRYHEIVARLTAKWHPAPPDDTL